MLGAPAVRTRRRPGPRQTAAVLTGTDREEESPDWTEKPRAPTQDSGVRKSVPDRTGQAGLWTEVGSGPRELHPRAPWEHSHPPGSPPRLQAGGHWLCLGHRQRRSHPRSLLQQLTGAPDYESHLTLLMATSWVPVPTPGQQETCVPSEGALRTSPTSAPIPLHGQSLRHLRPPSR